MTCAAASCSSGAEADVPVPVVELVKPARWSVRERLIGLRPSGAEQQGSCLVPMSLGSGELHVLAEAVTDAVT